MFERSAQREESFTANPATATTQVAPQRSEGVADIRVAFFDLTFLGETRKGRRLPGRNPASKNNLPAGSEKATQANVCYGLTHGVLPLLRSPGADAYLERSMIMRVAKYRRGTMVFSCTYSASLECAP